MKICGKCQKELPKNTDWFDKDSTKADGFKKWCKNCRKERRQKAELIQAAELMKKLDIATLTNLAEAKPGGTTIPHQAEVYQHVMALMGGVQGYAMHLVSTYLASAPGGQTRERILAQINKMGANVSDSNKVSMPAELMSDEDLDKELTKREQRMKVIKADFTDGAEPEPGRNGPA